jgi:hypothetical protein
MKEKHELGVFGLYPHAALYSFEHFIHGSKHLKEFPWPNLLRRNPITGSAKISPNTESISHHQNP